MSTSENPAFVFIHGGWHNAHCWDKVTAFLKDRDYASVAFDLPGAGENAKCPESFYKRPVDPTTFGTEPSPNAGTTQAERTQATLDAIDKATKSGNGKVILVGHSLAGLTLSPAVQHSPDKVQAVVYLSAYMLPNGMPAGAIFEDKSMAGSQVMGLMLANPAKVGALRLDNHSSDSGYLGKIKSAFYGDLSDDDFKLALDNLHCDEPAAVVRVPSDITSDKFGTVARHYIRCTQDNAIPITGQDHMIALVDANMGNQTTTHTLETSHSSFYSQPEKLVDILVSIAG
ncbi:MAG TPA: alpha/beta fold hydrolase [Terriglobales bacterium]|nr:alpha/beta fold hydrolase [Terriglobales bacterium]